MNKYSVAPGLVNLGLYSSLARFATQRNDGKLTRWANWQRRQLETDSNDPQDTDTLTTVWVTKLSKPQVVLYVLYPDEGHDYQRGGRFEPFNVDFKDSSAQVPGEPLIPDLASALKSKGGLLKVWAT